MSDDQLEELRVLVRSGRYVQAARDAEALIAEGALGPSEEAKAYLILAVAQYQTQQVVPALHAARRAETLAGKCLDTATVARARINLVAFLRDIGDTGMAVEVGAQLLAEEANLPAEVRKDLPTVHYNLSRVYRSQGEHNLMYDHVALAIAKGQETGAPASFLVMAHQQAAWWRYLDEHMTKGDSHFREADALTPVDDWEGVREQLLLTCLRAHQVGNMARAADLAEEFLTKGTQSTLLQRTWACYIAASAALYLERMAEAVILIERAMELALELYWPEQMNRVNDLRKRIVARQAESAGD